MLHTIWKGASLRSWVGLGMATAVLPLAASALAGYVILHRGLIASFQDVAARQRDQIDPTQRLREAIVEAFARHHRLGEQFALLLLDLDHFKRVNDTYGHSVGDDVLRAASQAIASQVRPFDRVFRFGGEEFAAILGGVVMNA